MTKPLIERLEKLQQQAVERATNNEAVATYLAPELDRVHASQPANIYAAKLAVEHRNNARTDRAEAQTLQEAIETQRQRDFLVEEYERAVGCGPQGYVHAAMHLFNAITNAQVDQNAKAIETLRVEVDRLEHGWMTSLGELRAAKLEKTQACLALRELRDSSQALNGTSERLARYHAAIEQADAIIQGQRP